VIVAFCFDRYGNVYIDQKRGLGFGEVLLSEPKRQ
jgi:hypothetical protein